MKTILLKIDEDNDIFEMSIDNKVYTLDNVYQSKYSKLFFRISTLLARLGIDVKQKNTFFSSNCIFFFISFLDEEPI